MRTPRTTSVAVLLSAALSQAAAAQQHDHAAVASPAAKSTSVPVTKSAAPAPVMREVTVSLTASETALSLVPGRTSDVYAYNGQVPGPTLEFREGDRVTVRFRNDLPVETTVHWHGLHIPFDADGSPFHPVAPGSTHDYVFTIRRGAAGTYWYHPHPHHATGRQVAKGLYGAIVIRAADDPLPATLRERIVLLSDNRFSAEGAVDLPEPGSHAGQVDAENGREGDVLFVNGTVLPTFGIRSGEVQRWRVINASAARVYRLAIPGHVMLHVGSDGGLFERPVEVSEIVLGNGERAELLIRGTGAPGSTAALQTLPYDRYIPQTRPGDWTRTRNLATLRYTEEPRMTPPPLPAILRHVLPLDTLAATATRVMVLTQHLINGRAMDVNRVDVESTLGATEIWQVENLVGMDHPFHLHGFQFQVLDRDGVPEPYRSWKDVVNVPKHTSVRFIVRYDNHPGKWMFHCHILDHEDHGMMGVLEVR